MNMNEPQEYREICPGCGRSAIPDVCWCGDDEKHHGIETGHGFVPLGCVCGYVTKPVPVPANWLMKSLLWKVRQDERDRCKKDSCQYCAGHCPPYHKIPDGPNEAGNWVHFGKIGPYMPDPVLCRATGIFAREKFELAQASADL